jgi:hypothetical protein
MSTVVLNTSHPYFPPGTWKAVSGLNPASYQWTVLQHNGVWTTSIDPSHNRLLITNRQTNQGWIYALQRSPNAPVQASNKAEVRGVGAVSDDTPTGTGFDSGDSTQVEANPTPDVPEGSGGGSSPMTVNNSPDIISTSGDPTTLLWVLGGLVLVAGSLAVYTYSKKKHSKGGNARKGAHRRRR